MKRKVNNTFSGKTEIFVLKNKSAAGRSSRPAAPE
jgi:hypothetical protein